MRASIVKIGNSKGIRIPRSVLAQCGFVGEVDLLVRQRRLVIQSAHRARAGWDAAFVAMAQRGDDALLDSASLSATQWDRGEWEW